MILTVSDRTIEFEQGETLLAVLQRAGVPVFAPCSGRGSCGKCKVKLNCFTNPTAAERALLTQAELDDGVRLACQTVLEQDCAVQLVEEPKTMAVTPSKKTDRSEKPAHLRAFCDLGTTTVTVAFVNESNEIVDTVSRVNAQIAYGADVLTRIGNKEKQPEMTRLIREQLREMVGCKVNELVVSGNTAMLHLLAGADASALGVAPFTPSFTDPIEIDIGSLTVRTLPCLDAFIGADTAAGVLFAEPGDEYKMLIDLGTNAEIALFDRTRLLAVSAPAGPAFEGANIRCGCAAVEGAISSFRFENGQRVIETVGLKPPVGLCGSGLLTLIAALLAHGELTPQGQLKHGVFDVFGAVKLYAEDVHAFLLAKAAVRTAIDLLLQKAEVDAAQVSAVLLSGGFGTFLDPASAAAVGLLPPALAQKATAAGNTSLLGAIAYGAGRRLLPPERTVFNLSREAGFHDCFLRNCTFGTNE